MCEVAHTAVLLRAVGWLDQVNTSRESAMTDRTGTVEYADTAPQAPSRDAIRQVLGWRRAALAGVCGITAVVAIGGWIGFLGWLAFTLIVWIVA
jgi:hypothetical protein